MQLRPLRWLGIGITAVVLLLGLAGALLPKWRVDSSVTPAEAQARRLRAAVLSWREKHPGGGCPEVHHLRAEGFLGARDLDVDPWGTPFTFTCQPDEVVVVSVGPDRLAGTADDVFVPRSARGIFQPPAADAGAAR